MPRRMVEPEFRQEQWESRWAPHIEPINRFVDSLKGPELEQWIPYVAPIYGGINAELLNVLRDPGPKTLDGTGSGFICLENDDPTAENMCNLLSNSAINPSRAMLWNAYPWYINKKPNAGQLRQGVRVLEQLLSFLPKLKVIMLNGIDAQKAWDRALQCGVEVGSNVQVIKTFHTSRLAMNIPSQRADVEAAFQHAAKILIDET